jgi:hypothetical protein
MPLLPSPLAAYPPVIKTCGFCSRWRMPDEQASAYPRGDAAMAAMGLRPCAMGAGARYLDATHPCHVFNPD